MGWSSQHRRGDGIPDREFLVENVLNKDLEILDYAKAGTTHFFVVPYQGQIIAIVVLTNRDREGWFAWKTLTDSSGPGDDRCPKRLLDRLSAPENEDSADWRKRCHERRARLQAAANLKPGDVVRFASPIKFGDGSEFDTFRFVERSVFKVDGCAGTRFRITGWRERSDWELVAA